MSACVSGCVSGCVCVCVCVCVWVCACVSGCVRDKLETENEAYSPPEQTQGGKYRSLVLNRDRSLALPDKKRSQSGVKIQQLIGAESNSEKRK